MKKKIIFIILLIIVLLCFYLVQYFSSVNFSIGNDKWLITNHNYIETDDTSQNIYVIYKEDNLVKFEKHNVEDNGIIQITIPIGKEFKISLPANSMVSYKWRIDSEINEQIISYLGDDYITPTKNKLGIKKGAVELIRRQNLNLYSKGVGSTTIDLKFIYNEEEKAGRNNKVIINVVDESNIKK
ncbi:protease inhibitor I42 family protein [Clostridium ihumii]|uniref:protease inhibitor I42 family protein n=1 Tax=Clostridium ihumii TaxID=1470356 RepID=UPI003D3592ED